MENKKKKATATAKSEASASASKTAKAAVADTPANEEAAVEVGVEEPAYPAFLEDYIKAYPGERVFHVTSDHQVFLDKDYGLAVNHQRSLPGDDYIQTYNL